LQRGKLYYLFLIIIINCKIVFSNPDYVFQVSGIEKTNDSTIEFEVYLKSQNSAFELTSYQCAFTFNPEIVNGTGLSFSYVEGTSQLINLNPQAGIGVNTDDGIPKLTFASMPGSETIPLSFIRIGRFKLITNSSFNNLPLNIQWSFDGKINTIVTGSNFDNITNPADCSTFNSGQLNIVKVTASATTDTLTAPEKTIDGKGSEDGDPDSRWAADPMPQYLIFDLGSAKQIDSTLFSFYKWNSGRIYNYSIETSCDSINWDSAVTANFSEPQEWTSNIISKKARYVKLIFNSCNQINFAGLWEARIYGSSDSLNHITLPVELESFAGKLINNSVELSWKTVTEINNKGFEIERKINAVTPGNKREDWNKIGFVNGSGSSTVPQNYKFIDNLKYESYNTIVAYRIKQIDLDGSSNYSNEVNVKVDLRPKEFVLYQNYPNPFNPSTDIKYSLPMESKVVVVVYNTLGEKVKEFNEGIKEAGNHDIIFQSDGTASGVYFYTINAVSSDGKSEFRKTQKMMLLK
jgi:hypothetical protein